MSDKLPACRGFRQRATQEDIDRLEACRTFSAGGGSTKFGGARDGAFFALEAESGKPLWHFQTGGQISANPVSFLVDRKQRVAIAAGQAIFVFAVD